MLYSGNNPILQIQTVGRFSWQARTLSVDPRPFSALAFRLEGGGTLHWGEKSHRLSAGDILYMPQGVAYRHEYSDTDLLLFHFVTQHSDPEPEIYHPQQTEEFRRLFQKAAGIWEEKGPGYAASCMSILYKILMLLAQNEAQIRLPAHFLRAMELLHENFLQSDLRISDICRQATISQTVFRQLFQAQYGMPPVAYITQLRLEHARNLIACGCSVEKAALKSGFSDGKYFSRVVKHVLGCTPRQLKQYGK